MVRLKVRAKVMVRVVSTVFLTQPLTLPLPLALPLGSIPSPNLPVTRSDLRLRGGRPRENGHTTGQRCRP